MEGNNIMHRKIFSIVGGAILICLTFSAFLVLNTDEATADKKLSFKLNEQVKYSIIREKPSKEASKISVLHKFNNKNEIEDFVALSKEKISKLS
ncbi:MAG: hypothetical protein QHH15_06465, partial [Candidatus Thermoplasmatota archaeon]|nr:hypothetical protein [Candidatus Thermoplasmatota archaeon]